jgi:hypothetical protein
MVCHGFFFLQNVLTYFQDAFLPYPEWPGEREWSLLTGIEPLA